MLDSICNNTAKSRANGLSRCPPTLHEDLRDIAIANRATLGDILFVRDRGQSIENLSKLPKFQSFGSDELYDVLGRSVQSQDHMGH